MSKPTSSSSESGVLVALPASSDRWKRRALVFGIPAIGVLLLLVLLWNVFFRYVPPGHMLVIISKNGTDLPSGQMLAEEGQRGIQRKVLGEGWHFVLPIVYTTELKPNVVIEPGKVGIVTALGGVPPRDGRVLAEEDDEKGIRRQVLLPGSYRINPYGYKVESVPMTTIEPGFIGIKRRLLGVDGSTQFATRPTEKGIVKNEILQPGIYPLNTLEYQVIPCEVGIDQTTYNYVATAAGKARKDTRNITFPAKDGNEISLDCTIEWELKPEHWPEWLAKYGALKATEHKGSGQHRQQNAQGPLRGNVKAIEQIVIDQHARKISRDRGFNYGAQDFLDGEKREKFQADFRAELDKVCKADNVVVRSAFIRNIIIPDTFLEQKRLERIAVETKLTSEALTLTASSDAEVAEAKQMIDQRIAEVEAETTRLVALIARETQNVQTLTKAEIEKIRADYGRKIGELDTQRKRVLGEAEAEATKLKETAKSSLYKMKMEVFGQEGDAFLRYTLAEKLNPEMRLRLFQSGPGTLWTNMGNKSMNFMLPLPNGESKAPAPVQEKKEKEKSITDK
jgi:hypothetical protein